MLKQNVRLNAYGILLCFLVSGIIILSGCLGNSTVKDTTTVNSVTPTPTPKQTVDMSKIDYTFGETNLFTPDGRSVASKVTVKNNNNVPITVELDCTIDMNTGSVPNFGCYNKNPISIESSALRVVELTFSATYPGTYSTNLQLKVLKESRTGNYWNGDYTILAEVPITFTYK